MPPTRKTSPTRRRRRPRVALRWLAFGAVALLAFLYYRPLKSYLQTRQLLASRAADVRALKRERARLQKRLATGASDQAFTARARKLGLVHPGERIFIVTGIDEWRRAHRASIGAGVENR